MHGAVKSGETVNDVNLINIQAEKKASMKCFLHLLKYAVAYYKLTPTIKWLTKHDSICILMSKMTDYIICPFLLFPNKCKGASVISGILFSRNDW